MQKSKVILKSAAKRTVFTVDNSTGISPPTKTTPKQAEKNGTPVTKRTREPTTPELPPTKKAKSEQHLPAVPTKPDSSDPSIAQNVVPGLSFNDLAISDETKKALKDMGLTTMKEIQSVSIPESLKGIDILGKAKTGSGKTLAFLIPIIERLVKSNVTRKSGIGAVIVSPTRELTIQIVEVAKKLTKYHKLSVACTMGGTTMSTEAKTLDSGVNLLVTTPGRACDHLENTRSMDLSKVKILVLDEADHLLEMGFQKQLNQIVYACPQERQTMLFSATFSRKVEELTRMSIREGFAEIDTDKAVEGQSSTPTLLEQEWTKCTDVDKISKLYSYLNEHKNEKIVVFFATGAQVKWHADLFTSLGLPSTAISGKVSQNRRTKIFFEFQKVTSGILFATDVIARGIDFPGIHRVVQYDIPGDIKEYIHRVGRTARAGKAGKALVLLTPPDMHFLKTLPQNIPIEEITLQADPQIQKQIVRYAEQDYPTSSILALVRYYETNKNGKVKFDDDKTGKFVTFDGVCRRTGVLTADPELKHMASQPIRRRR